MRIYTRRGDDGSTGLFHGGRVPKDDSGPEAYGAVDEAVSALGLARQQAPPELADQILSIQRDLFAVAAELATAAHSRQKLEAGTSLVTAEMVTAIEQRIDAVVEDVGLPTEFVVPGGSATAAALDFARTVIRKAERRAVTHVRVAGLDESEVVRYLNRLADYVYLLARSQEQVWQPSKEQQ